MKPARYLLLVCVAGGAVFGSGCGWFRKSKPAPPAVILPPPRPATAPKPSPLPPPPEIGEEQAGVPPAPATAVPEPSKPQPLERAGPRATAPQAPPQPAAPQPPLPAAEPVPRLTQLLTPAEQAAYNREIDQALRNAEANLSRLAGRKLSREQALNLERARAFLQQAREARTTDLVIARGLAQRGDVLIQDLVNSLR